MKSSFGAQSSCQLCHYLITGSFKDIDEVILPQQSIVVQYLNSHIFHFFVDFPELLWVILNGFSSGISETVEHKIDRHHYLLLGRIFAHIM
ncbi:hypothetical protein ES703_96805 [subsurface metagenome]